MKSQVREDVERIAGAPENKMKPEAMAMECRREEWPSVYNCDRAMYLVLLN